MSELDIASVDIDGLDQCFQRLENTLNGQSAGVESFFISEDTLDEAEQHYESAKQQYQSDRHNPGLTALLSLSKAAHRDANYALRGRKFMTVLGIRKKMVAVSNRGEIISNITE